MKVQYQVVEVTRSDREHVVSTHDTEEEAVAEIEKTPADLMGTVEFTIRKIWTNRR